MKQVCISILVLCTTVLVIVVIFSAQNHVSPVFAVPSFTSSSVSSPASNPCSSCHSGSAAAGGSAAVNFPSGLTYTPGVTQQLSVKITDPTHTRGGYLLTARLASGISSQAGSFTATNSNSTVAPNGSIQDIEAANFATLTWNFSWTPPATASGNVNFYLVGLATGSPGGTTSGNGVYQSVATLTPAAPVPDFSLSASPASLTVVQGSSGASTVTVAPLNGFTGSVSLSASGLPSGVTASFSPSSATTTSSLTLTASSTAATGTSTITITGISGSLSHTTTVALTVGLAPNFSLSASPGSVTIAQGASGASTITVAPQNGFTGGVTLSASGLPSGVTASFSPSSATTTSSLTLTAGSTATTGTSTITIAGTSGSLSHTTTVALTVTTPPDFTLSASPGSLTIAQGFSSSTTITVTSQNSFTGTVSLSASGLPSGVTASFSPSSTTSTSTLKLTASTGATIGAVTIAITGTSGSLSHAATVALTISATAQPDFSLSASPASLTVVQGSSGASTVTVAPQNGFTGGVTLSASGLPSGVTASFSPSSATTTSSLTLMASSTAATGTSTITITGISGSLSHTTTVALTVGLAPNFSLSASPGSVTIAQGASGASTITVAPQNGFTGGVTLSASGLPSGVTASFSPSSATTTSSLTLTAGSTATTGTSTITIAGTSGSLSHTTTVALTVNVAAPVLAVTPTTLTFSYVAGSPTPAPQAISVTASSTAASFTAAAVGGTWLSLTPTTGTTPGTVSVTLNPGSLAAGTYNDTVNISSSSAANSPLTVQIALVVSSTSSTRKLSTTTASTYPNLLIDSTGNYNVAWTDSTAGVFFSRSIDQGATFPTSVVIQGSPGAAFQPQLTVDASGNNVDVVWAEATSVPGSYNVLFSRSTDGGQHFATAPTSLTTVALPLAGPPRIAGEAGGAVDIVWGRNETWAIRSSDGAIFATPAVLISTTAQDSGGARAAVDSTGKIYVAWTDEVDKLAAGSYCLQTNTSGTAAFTNTLGGNFYFNITNSGSSFDPRNTRNLSNTDWAGVTTKWRPGFFGCSYDNLFLLVDSQNNLHLIWSDDMPDQQVLASAYPLTDSSGNLRVSFPTVLSLSPAASPNAVAATNSSGKPIVHVVWSDGPGDTTQASPGIFYTHSTDTSAPFGQTFAGPATRIASSASEFPQVAVDSTGNANVAWQQNDASAASAFDVLLAASFDGGNTFTAPVPVSTQASIECLGTNKTDTTQVPPPPYNTCGSVQMKTDSAGAANLVWVNLSGSSSDILFSHQTVPAPAADFTMTLANASQTLTNGTATYTLTFRAGNGFNQPVTIDCPSGLPPGATCSNPRLTPTASGTSAVVTVTMTSTLPSGTYQFAIRGDAGLTSHSVQATLVVGGTTAPDFSLSLSAPSVSTLPGQTANYTVNLGSTLGFNAFVSITCAGLPSGTTCAAGPSSVVAPGSATVTVAFPSSLAPGAYAFTIMGSSGGTNHSQIATLNVGTINVAVSPSASATIGVGTSASFSLSLSSSNGSAGTISLSCSGVSGLSCGFNPTQIGVPGTGTVNTTMTVTVSAKPASGLSYKPLQLPPNPSTRSAAFSMTLLLILTVLFSHRRGATLTGAAVRGLAAWLLIILLGAGMISCAALTSGPGNGTVISSSSSATQLMLQAQSGTATISLGTISITVP